jgi:hypothetical protein
MGVVSEANVGPPTNHTTLWPTNPPCKPTTQDPNTLANISQVRAKHLDLDLQVDFDRKAFVGSVTITFRVRSNININIKHQQHHTSRLT